MRTVPSGGVYRTELTSRFVTTRASSASAARTVGPAGLRGEHPDPPVGGQRRGGGDRVGDHVAERHRGQRGPQRSGGDPGQLEQIVDQARHPVRLDPDPAVVLGHRRRLVDHPVLQCLRHRPQPGQRRTQVVGDPRDQLAAAGLQLPFPLPGLVGPDRRLGEAAGERHPDGQAERRGRGDRDEDDLEVVRGQEHGLGDGGDARRHRGDGDREQHRDVREDRPVAHQPQRADADRADRSAGEQGVEPDDHQFVHRDAADGSYR